MIKTKKIIIFITIISTFSLLQASNSVKEVSKASYGQMFSNFVKETLSSPESYKGRTAIAFVSLILSGAGSAYATYQLYKRVKEASETLTEFEKNGSKNLNVRLFPRYFIKTLLTLGGLGVSSLILYYSWQQFNNPIIYREIPSSYF